MSLNILTLLVTLTIIQINSKEFCHKAVKLSPGLISKYNYEQILSGDLENRPFDHKITAKMYIRNIKTPEIAEVVLKNANLNCHELIRKRLCAEQLKVLQSVGKIDLRCPNNNEVKMYYQRPKPLIERHNSNEFLNLEWLLFIMSDDVIDSLKRNAPEFTTPLTASFENVEMSGTLKHTFNYSNSGMYEVNTICERFETPDASDAVGIFKGPMSFVAHTVMDKNDFSVQELTGLLNISTFKVLIEVKFKFDGHLSAEENKQVFENRSIPILIEDKADVSLTRLIEPEVGFDAKWKLVVANLSHDSRDGKPLNKPVEGDVILRNIGDPRFVVWKLVLPQDDTERLLNQSSQKPFDQTPSGKSTLLNDVGLVSFSSDGFLLFDLLGDYRLRYLLPIGVRDTLDEWKVVDVEALRHFNDSRRHSFTTELNPEFWSGFTWNLNKACEVEHSITRSEDEIKVVVELSKTCVTGTSTWKFRCEQVYRATDQKLKGINLFSNNLENIMLNASLNYVGSVPAKNNDALFEVYGDPVDLQWFNSE